MNEDSLELLDVAGDVFQKVSDDLEDPDNLEILTSWGEVIDELKYKNHGDIVVDSLIILQDVFEHLNSNYDAIKDKWGIVQENTDIHDDDYTVLKPLSHLMLNIFVNVFQRSSKLSDKEDPQYGQAVNALVLLCINHVLSLVSSQIRTKTNGVVDEQASIRMPNMERMRDKESSVKFISDVALGRTNTNFDFGGLGNIFSENEKQIKNFIDNRIEQLSSKNFKDHNSKVLNKLLIRTYKTMKYDYEVRAEEREKESVTSFGHDFLLLFNDSLNYLLEQLVKVGNRALIDDFVKNEYSLCRSFVIKTWTKNMLDHYKNITKKQEQENK